MNTEYLDNQESLLQLESLNEFQVYVRRYDNGKKLKNMMCF